MGAVEFEYQGASFSLEHQPVIERIPAFEEITDHAHAYSPVKMRPSIGFAGGAHGSQDCLQPLLRKTAKTPPERSRSLEFHWFSAYAFKSAMLETTRTVPARRSLAIRLRRRAPTAATSLSFRPYSSFA